MKKCLEGYLKNYYVALEPIPPKKISYFQFYCFGDLGNPRKCPQTAGDLETSWSSPRCSGQISGMFQTDFEDVLGKFYVMFSADFEDIMGMHLQFWQWTLMIGPYDIFSHPFFLYYTESKSVVQVASQNMGFVWWVSIWVSGDLSSLFNNNIHYSKQSPHVKKPGNETFERPNPFGYCSCSFHFWGHLSFDIFYMSFPESFKSSSSTIPTSSIVKAIKY